MELIQKVMQQDVMNYYESILFALAETIDVSLYEQSKEQLQKQLVEIEKKFMLYSRYEKKIRSIFFLEYSI